VPSPRSNRSAHPAGRRSRRSRARLRVQAHGLHELLATPVPTANRRRRRRRELQGRLSSERYGDRVTLSCSPLASRFFTSRSAPLESRSLPENIGAEAALHNLRIGRKAFTARLCGAARRAHRAHHKGPQRSSPGAHRGPAPSNINRINWRCSPILARRGSRPIAAEKRRCRPVQPVRSGMERGLRWVLQRPFGTLPGAISAARSLSHRSRRSFRARPAG
jgi:hypothetical protein